MIEYNYESKGNLKLYLLFILWPFVSLIYAIFNYDQRDSKIVIYFFLIFYGATFIIPNEGVDAYRYAEELKFYSDKPFNEYFYLISSYQSKTNNVDLLLPTVNFIVSRFSESSNLLFAFFAAIFGLFYLKGINIAYKNYKSNENLNSLVFLLFFIILIPITRINGFRFWTASWYFFCCAYLILTKKEKKYLFLCYFSILIHWSFMFPAMIMTIYYFLGNKTNFYIIIMIISFFTPDLLSRYIPQISHNFETAIQKRLTGYSDIDYNLDFEETLGQTRWFIKYNLLIMKFYFVFMVLFLHYKFRHLYNKILINLFSFLMLFLSFVNFGSSMFSVSRYLSLFYVISSLYAILLFSRINFKKMYWLTNLGLFPFVLHISLIVRFGIITIDTWLLTPIIVFYFSSPISIYELLF